SSLTREPLVALPPALRSTKQETLLAEARAMEAESPDTYWAWVAEHFRWSRRGDAGREGGFGDLRYFPGGMINVADNCVDRHAENPVTANRAAVIWEGEDGAV